MVVVDGKKAERRRSTPRFDLGILERCRVIRILRLARSGGKPNTPRVGSACRSSRIDDIRSSIAVDIQDVESLRIGIDQEGSKAAERGAEGGVFRRGGSLVQ